MDMNVYQKLVEFIKDFWRENGLMPDELAVMLDKCKIDALEGLFEAQKDLYVLKKDGRVEKFDEKKLSNSIGGASDEIAEPLNASDIDNIVQSVLERFSEESRKVVSSHAIKVVALETLKELGFTDVCESYKKFIKDY